MDNGTTAKSNNASAPSCGNCAHSIMNRRASARFCGDACQKAFHKRMEREGRVVMPLVRAWIAGKGGGHSGSHPIAGRCLSEITSIVRHFMEVDAENGRPSPIPYAEASLAYGIYADRCRGVLK